MLLRLGHPDLSYRINPLKFDWAGGNQLCIRQFVIWYFLHDRPWISPWIKSISNELDITCHVFASPLSGHCDVIANRLWRHQQNVKRASETRDDVWRSPFLVLFMDYRVRNKIMYVLLWRTVYALTRVLFWCVFPSLLRNSRNKHQNNTLVSA